MSAPPSGQDTLQVRQAYFRKRRTRHFGEWGFTAVGVSLATIVSWLFIVGLAGFGH
jgi:hypothetical protein